MKGLGRPGDVFNDFQGTKEKKRKFTSLLLDQVPLHRDASRRSIHIGRADSA
jgi:hypothetical protein